MTYIPAGTKPMPSFDWVTIGVWAVSTTLHWLTKKKPTKPRTQLVEAPTVKDGCLVPVFWGTVTIFPANVKFEYKRKDADYTEFFVQDVICLGVISRIWGSFYGGEFIPFGYDDYVYDYSSQEQPVWYPITQVKYSRMSIRGAGIDDFPIVYYIEGEPYYYHADKIILEGWANGCKADGCIGVGYPSIFGYPYPNTDAYQEKLFPSDIYTNRSNLPTLNYLTVATFYTFKVKSTIPARSYKVARTDRDLMGNLLPSWGFIYRYVEVVPMLDRPEEIYPYIESYNECLSEKSVNPMCIIKEVLTSPLLNMKIDSSRIDNVSYEYCGQKLHEEKFGLNIALSSQDDANGDFIQEILSYIEGFMFVDTNPESATYRKIKFKLARPDYDPDSLDILDDSVIISVDDYTCDMDSKDTINSVVVSYTNRFARKEKFQWFAVKLYAGYDEERTVVIRDDDDVGRRGLFEETIERPWISDVETAVQIGRRYLYLNSIKPVRVKITGLWQLSKYNIGGVIKLVHPKLGFNGVVLRIFNKDVESLDNGNVILSCVEDYYGAQYSVFGEEKTEKSVPIVENTKYYQPSAWELISYLGEFNFSQYLNTIPIKFIAESGNAIYEQFYRIYKKSPLDPDYVVEDQLNPDRVFYPPEYIVLDVNMDYNTNTDMSDSEISDLPNGMILLIDDELVRVSDRVFMRACYDTELSTHAEGTKCYIIFHPKRQVSNDVRNFVEYNTGLYYSQVLAIYDTQKSPASATQELQIDSNVSSRYDAPLNCTGVRVNGLLWDYSDNTIPVSDRLSVVFSWNNKSRLNCGSNSSDGIASIYDETSNLNLLEEDCSYVFEFLDGADNVLRSIVVPFSQILPSLENTSLEYTSAMFASDYPTSDTAKVRIWARRLKEAPSTYVYSLVSRIVLIKRVCLDMLYPSSWFLYLRQILDAGFVGLRKVFSYKNIFYPEWYGQPYSILTTFSLDGSEPQDPTNLSAVPSFTSSIIVPVSPSASFTIGELVAKTWVLKSNAIISGVFKGINRVAQSAMFYPPNLVIKSESVSLKRIYVASNTDYYSDWFDTHYNYDLYLSYVWVWVRQVSENVPDKDETPDLPIWSSDIESHKISRYDSVLIDGGTPQIGKVLCVFARAMAKLTRKSDSMIFWTNEYILKSWQGILSPANPFRTLKIFPKPIVTITETPLSAPPRYFYTISVSAPSGAEWELLNWEWRLAILTTTGATKPVLTIEPNNNNLYAKNVSYVLTVLANSRLRFLVCAVDVIVDRTLDTYNQNLAKITPQTYAEWIRP